jgi:hypothetical protein
MSRNGRIDWISRNIGLLVAAHWRRFFAARQDGRRQFGDHYWIVRKNKVVSDPGLCPFVSTASQQGVMINERISSWLVLGSGHHRARLE